MILKDLKNNERGSITVLVLSTMLLVVGIIFISYFSMMNKSSSQAAQIEKIQEEYNQSNSMTRQVYDEVANNDTETPTIPGEDNIDETSHVGYYADFEGDGTVDGVIYVDLAVGASGQWGRNYDTYQISKVSSGLKEYYVSQTDYDGPFGLMDVLSPQGEGKDRFYVMALNDVDSQEHSESEALKYLNQGGQWHLPSKTEWTAFGGELEIKSSNYHGYGLRDVYWSSTKFPTSRIL